MNTELKHALSKLLYEMDLASGIIGVSEPTCRDGVTSLRIIATDDYTDAGSERTYDITVRERA